MKEMRLITIPINKSGTQFTDESFGTFDVATIPSLHERPNKTRRGTIIAGHVP